MRTQPGSGVRPGSRVEPGSGGVPQAIGRRGAAGLLAGILVLYAGGVAVAAPANQLRNGSVQPGSGTTATSFVFTVRYRSGQENEPTSVTAVAGNVVVPLRLISGQPFDGRYRGSASLPVGTWTVVFQATARGNNPSLDGPTVTVSRAPPPRRGQPRGRQPGPARSPRPLPRYRRRLRPGRRLPRRRPPRRRLPRPRPRRPSLHQQDRRSRPPARPASPAASWRRPGRPTTRPRKAA
jgi:hypothetical protein